MLANFNVDILPGCPGSLMRERNARRNLQDWWKTYFTKEWLLLEPMKSKEVNVRSARFIVNALKIPSGARILDLGCGYGRISIELARMGYRVVGLDFSDDLLEIARQLARDQGVRVDFVQGDMRQLDYRHQFNAVVSWGTSFGFFSDKENEQVLQLVSQALTEDGKLLLDLHNRDAYIRKYVGTSEYDYESHKVRSIWTFDIITSRLNIEEEVLDKETNTTKTYISSFREYTIPELTLMLEKVGMTLVKIYGDLSDHFGLESDSLTILAEKTSDSQVVCASQQ